PALGQRDALPHNSTVPAAAKACISDRNPCHAQAPPAHPEFSACCAQRQAPWRWAPLLSHLHGAMPPPGVEHRDHLRGITVVLRGLKFLSVATLPVRSRRPF